MERTGGQVSLNEILLYLGILLSAKPVYNMLLTTKQFSVRLKYSMSEYKQK